MGFNDIGNNAEIWELQSRHLASLENIRRNATSDIRFATITPSGVASPKQLQTRRSYNAWLTQKNPQVIPFHHVVSEDDLSLRAEFDTDSTHMNTSGYMAMAHAVPTYGLSPGLQREYSTPDREGLEPVHLTRPLGNRTETITSRSSRIPFQLPRRTARWRVVLINQNLRSNQAYKGQVRIRFLGYAPQKLGPDGKLTSSTISEPAPIASDLMIPDISEGWASPWVDEPLEAGTPYLLTLGYQTSGSETTLSMGGGWWTFYKPANAALAEDPTAQPTKRQPFDIRIEVVPESTNAQPSATDLVIGDSISAGSDASFPILEAPAAIANRDSHRYTRLNTHGGTSIGEWIGPAWGNPYSLKWHDITRYGRADRVIIALGNNDIHAGYSIERIKAAMQDLIRYARSRISCRRRVKADPYAADES